MGKREKVLREILAVPLVRWGKWVLGAVASYDIFSAQFRIEGKFEPPPLLELIGMSGGLLPWWGWLLIAQAGFIYALFEYVRRNVPIQPVKKMGGNDLAKIHVDLETKKQVDQIEGKLESVRATGAINAEAIDKLERAIRTERNQRALSFHALRVIGALETLEQKMQFDEELLSGKLLSGEVYDSKAWDSWESVNHHWETNLRNWVSHGQWFAYDIENRVFGIHENDFGGTWTVEDNQFPTADAQRRFKRHRILRRRWEALRDEVVGGVNSVAYNGMTDKEVQNESKLLQQR